MSAILPGWQSSGEIQLVDPDRAALVEQRHRQLSAFLKERKFDGLLLMRPCSFSWLTAGGDNTRGSSSDVTSALLITPEARVILSRNTDAGQIFDRQVGGLGFQLKERHWYEDRSILMLDVVRGRTVACDQPFERCPEVAPHLAGMRLPLGSSEIRTLRELGRIVSHAVEATARNFQQDDSEAEVAGQLAYRLIRHGVHPERIQVLADGQGHRYRHWSCGPNPIERTCVISAIGRQRGLHAGTSRTVCFGHPTDEIRQPHLDSLLVQATGMFFSQRQWELYETWSRIERIYEKFGHSEEWHFADQGCVTGYELCEAPIVPRSQFRLTEGMPMIWQPSIGPALTMDTMLIGAAGFEMITPMENWPQINVDVKGVMIPRPDVLIRRERPA